MSLQGGGGKGFAVVRLGHHAPMRTDASPFPDEQDAAEKIGLHVEPIENGACCAPDRCGEDARRSKTQLAIVQRLTL